VGGRGERENPPRFICAARINQVGCGGGEERDRASDHKTRRHIDAITVPRGRN